MRKVDLFEMAANSRFTSFHGLVLAWCALIIIFDGYDLVVAGVALPSIMDDLGVNPTQAGVMVSSALFGAMCGAIIFGVLADKIGRRRAIVICVALFSIFTAAAGLAQSPVMFGVSRFVAGLGIGGVMPAVVAHMTEYSPRRLRTTLVTLMFSGYSVGGMIAAFLGRLLIEDYGWRSVFVVAAAPVLIIPFLLKTMPESMAYLASRRKHAELGAITSRLDPHYVFSPGDQFLTHAQAHKGGSMRALFADGRATSTCMFWIAFFMCLFMVYALSSWLAKLMISAGYGLGSSLFFIIVLNIGGVIGAIGGGVLADRFGTKRILLCMFAMAGVSIALLGYKPPPALLNVLLCVAGASTIGTQIVVYAYAGQYYPMAIKTTGIGWASGVGRGGAISAPIIIGAVVALGLPLKQNFVLMAIPAAIAWVAVMFIDLRRKSGQGEIRAHAEDSPVGDAKLAASLPATNDGRM